MTRRLGIALLCSALCSTAARAAPGEYFAVRVVDADTGRGVPLAILKTTYHAKYVTDSGGYLAFNEPGIMDGRDVWFEVDSYGYESPAGNFGVRGVQLKPMPGKTAEIKLKRKQVAERLYRLTGYGIYRDTVLLGKKAPIKEPTINAQVTGQDTVQTAIYRGKMYWMWQDTDRLGFGLGGFSMTGATSALPGQLDPAKGIDFTYFVAKPGEFAKSMAVVPREGNNPIWVDGLTVVKDKTGRERMVGKYIAANKDFSPAEAGLLVYNDDKNVMEKVAELPNKGRGVMSPGGKAVYVRDGGVRYAFYNGNRRVKADYESVIDPAQYEGFTCLKPDGQPDRQNGRLVWAWKRGAEPVDFKKGEQLVKAGLLKEDEVPFRYKDVDGGKKVVPAGGSVAYNPQLKLWVVVFGQQGGDSMLGEVWMSVARGPEGPWTAAKKVATHAMKKDNQDFYNVVQHDELGGDGRYVYFSGTFVNTFSGTDAAMPYYSYNNILYRVDLTDPRTKLPDPPPALGQTMPDAK